MRISAALLVLRTTTTGTWRRATRDESARRARYVCSGASEQTSETLIELSVTCLALHRLAVAT
jgi:hypothetical protein